MIRQLRNRHRLVFAVLALLLPVIFIAGLLARKPIPRVESFPNLTARDLSPRAVKVLDLTDLWDELSIHTRV